MTMAQLPAPRAANPDRGQANLPARFDVDAYHVMDERDEQLIRERVLGGSVGAIFVYDFQVSGSRVTGVSVEGAQHLAHHYGKIKHRIVATQEKKGQVFTFTTYPGEGVPMQVSVAIVPELADEDDFYRAVVEVTDIKSGVSMQAERMETRWEKKRDGSRYERPNYSIIAQSKARRNAILMVVPQDVQEAFKAQCIAQGKGVSITDDVFAQKRDQVLAFATRHAIQVSRADLQRMGDVQIDALREAAKAGVADFRAALEALTAKPEPEPQPEAPAPAKLADQRQEPLPPHDPETGEVKDPEPVRAPAARPAAPRPARSTGFTEE